MPWNSSVFPLVVVVATPGVYSGLFIYSPAPGTGNLVASVAGSAGTDPYGNPYPAGANFAQLNNPQRMPAMINGWSVGGHATFLLDPIGNLVVSWKQLFVGQVADGTPVWDVGAIPVGFRPPNNRRVVCYSDGIKTVGGAQEMSALEIQADGSVQCYGFSVGATRADLFASIPIGF